MSVNVYSQGDNRPYDIYRIIAMSEVVRRGGGAVVALVEVMYFH